jgi:hypothetical protein
MKSLFIVQLPFLFTLYINVCCDEINNWISSFLITPFKFITNECYCIRSLKKHIFNVEERETILQFVEGIYDDMRSWKGEENFYIFFNQCLPFRSKCNFQLLYVIFNRVYVKVWWNIDKKFFDLLTQFHAQEKCDYKFFKLSAVF